MKLRRLMLVLVCALAASAQTGIVAKKRVAAKEKPVCSRGAICFSGRAAGGSEFRRAINGELRLVLEPGWTIRVEPTRPAGECLEFASVATEPYRAHRDLDIDMSYGWTAEEEVGTSPREFHFVTNCADLEVESDRLSKALWGYSYPKEAVEKALMEMGSSPMGTGRLWITKSKVSHSDETAEDKLGKIEWMEFSVEIKLPRRK